LRDNLKSELELKNVHEVPTITKIVVNSGVGRATQQGNLIEGAVKDLTAITGQKAAITRSKKSIAGFKAS
jgi:large subunit ribosomal protein L5